MQNQNLDELDILAEELILHRDVDINNVIRYYNSDGQLHRTHGPAVIWPNGDENWFQNDRLHHLDGPAAIYNDGTKFWFIDEEEYTEEAFNVHPLVIAYRAKNTL